MDYLKKSFNDFILSELEEECCQTSDCVLEGVTFYVAYLGSCLVARWCTCFFLGGGLILIALYGYFVVDSQAIID